MEISMSRLIAYARKEEAQKKLRYAGVSVVFVPFGQILIQIFGLWLDNYTAASLLMAAIVTVPNFFADKHFVWRFASVPGEPAQQGAGVLGGRDARRLAVHAAHLPRRDHRG
jgi:hypothetical protein